MKRTLLIVLVAVIAGFAVTHQLIAGKIGDQLDRMSQTLSAAGTLNYGNIFIIPNGTAIINRVVFYPNGTSGDVRIQKVSIETGNLKALYDLGKGLESGLPPEELKVAFEGIQTNIGTDFLTPQQSTNAETIDFFTSGCGERTYFSFADLDAMGYTSTLSDMTLQYRLSPARDRLTFNGEWVTRDMVGVEYSADMELPAGQAGPAAMMGLKLRHAKITLVDHGYMNAVLNFCARETGLDQATYRAHHLAAWEANWANYAVEPGEGMVAAYREFVEKPVSLSLETYPDATLMQAMSNPSPEALFQTFDPRIRANGGDPKPFRLAIAMDQWQQPKPTTSAGSPAKAAPKKPESTSTSNQNDRQIKRLSQAEWPQHLNQPVWVTLNDGRRFEGVILSMEGERMQFQQNVFDGQMVMPLQINQVADVHLKPLAR